jgi:type I restriction enzyme R subunit
MRLVVWPRSLASMVRVNPTRRNFQEQIEELIAEYNAGAKTVEQFFTDLLAFMEKLQAEEQRAGAEGLTQEELALYDLLLSINVKLTNKDRAAVKELSRELPKKLEKRLVIDWRKFEKTRAGVRVAIKNTLENLPKAYDDFAYEAALQAIFEHVYESYWGEGRSKYSEATATEVSVDAVGGGIA